MQQAGLVLVQVALYNIETVSIRGCWVELLDQGLTIISGDENNSLQDGCTWHIGSIHFGPRGERLMQYFAANNITSKQKQCAVVISSCSVSTYHLIKNLLASRAPSKVELDELISTVTAHCKPPPSKIMQRYPFNTYIRRPHETISTYLANLKQIA